MDTTMANATQSVVAKTITIKDIELYFPSQRKSPIARRFYVQFSVGNTGARSTRCTKEAKHRTSWNEKIFFDGDDHSVLLVNVYQQHRIGKNELVGSLTDTIGGVFGELKGGVFEQTLRKDDRSSLSGVILKFSLTTQPCGDVNAGELQVTDAVAGATKAVNALGSMAAAVGLFSSVVDTGTNTVSEIQTFETTWDVLLERVKLFNEIVTGIAQIHPYASLAWSVISYANQVLVNQKDRDDRIIRLSGAMSDVFEFVKDAEPLKTINAHKATIRLLIQQTTECGYFITEYAKQKSFWIRTAKYAMSAIDSRIADFENKFKELKTAFLEGVAVQTEITVVRMMNVVNETAESIDLNDMPYAFGARFQQEKACLPGTRESFLEEICDVLNRVDEDAPRVCLLTGVAGSGKSAVAHSIAQLYYEQKRLGSSYCFASTDIARRNPQNLFSTIARDLSDHDPQYKIALWGIVRNDRALRTSQSPVEQVDKLIIEPSKQLDTIGPLVIVIDGLEESGDRASRRQLLSTISAKITDNAFPVNLRFLITTRPEDDILTKLQPSPQIVHKRIDDIPRDIVEEDIAKFIYHSLHEYTELESSNPDGEWCQLLVHHSQHLFQWASTACKYIQGDDDVGRDPRERLDDLLRNADTDGGHSLDKLYRTILMQLFTSENTKERFRTIMATVLALREPLSLSSLSVLLGGDPNIRLILKPMGSLLDGVLDEGKPIRPLHTSFRDFLLDEVRSAAFHVPILPQHSLYLGQAMVACMRRMLKFNICNLTDSRILNSDIPNLPTLVNEVIPPHLTYSCHYWMHHLQHADPTPDLSNEITLFFKSFFPYWLEAISLLSLSSPLLPILSALETCTILNKWTKDQEIATLASEASQFIQVFAPVLRQSTPQLYLSAMPQTPSSSPLYELWLNHLQKHVSVSSDHSTSWPAEVHILQGHMDSVSSVAYSPDGRHIASASWDCTIRVWNTTTSQCVAGPFEGHTDNVMSVAYSPDGKYIISGSWDTTIRVWNATTGQCMTDPLEGHSGGINFVVYSPDGNHIASGSADCTIRVWTAINGQCTADPFEGHTGPVCSIAYSPNGSYIVSGSGDQSIRVWSATSGQCVAGPFEGHAGPIWSVVYSPGGNHIASGSDDTTIRIWNATTGHYVVDPIQGQGNAVFSVAYSPDGKHIASGSWDNAIRVWDAVTGQLVAGPCLGHANTVLSITYSLDGAHIISGSADKTVRVWRASIAPFFSASFLGHTDLIRTVAYSPNGIHIASGSTDKTIGIWNATTGQSVADPLKGHTDEVYSVSYSPNGTHIISGTEDGTIQIWNAITGECVAAPFKGHTDIVRSVAFSPDGIHAASGSQDSTVRIWDITTGQCAADLFEGHTDAVYSIAYSPDGFHVVSGSGDQTIMIWNVTTGQSVLDAFHGHTDTVRSVAYSPDGTCVASGSDDGTIRVWNAVTSQCIAGPFVGHTSWVLCIAYSPGGTQIVSGSKDKTIRIWDAVTGQCIAGPLQGHTNDVQSIAYSPDGNHIATGSWDCSIKVWRVQELSSLDDFYEEDGWIHSSNVGYYGWLAPWNRNAFQLPIHSQVVSAQPIYHVDISDSSFSGESWTSCWI